MYKVVFIPHKDSMPDFAIDVEGREFDNSTTALCAARDVMIADKDKRLRFAYVQDGDGMFIFGVRRIMFTGGIKVWW